MDQFWKFCELYLGGTAMIASDMISFIKSDLQYFALGVLVMFIVTLSLIFKKITMGFDALSFKWPYRIICNRFLGMDGLESNSSFF